MSKPEAGTFRPRFAGRGTAASAAVNRSDDLMVAGSRPRNPISRAQIETVLSRSVAGISVIFALQSLPAVLHQFQDHASIGTSLMAGGLGVAIACVVLATVFKRGVRTATSGVAVVYLLAMAAWPFVVLHAAVDVSDKPWLWYLCTVATSCAAIGFSVRWAAIYTVVAPVTYGIVRMQPSGGQADLLLASLDVLYAVLLGQVVLIIITMLRTATSNVDTAQSNALVQYCLAVRQHATEVERVEVDSIVHDSVLATLLSAAGARTEKGAELAATMAANAVARLLDASAARPDEEARIPFQRLGTRLKHEAAASAAPFTFVDTSEPSVTVPEQVSEALFAAALQAMVNSVQHAGIADAPVARALTLSATPDDGCRIEIADSGVGFDSTLIPTERLGLRVSIQERVTSVGGFVCVRTSLGMGTIITLRWPRPDDQPPLEVEEIEGVPSIELDAPGNQTDLMSPGGANA
ncbi:sensor histidine kinase [Cryobacterium roopkundense]|uniref:Signal transduction histidine kinase n=1 Tax=Cryobacterium roopkundense TaxID=1001240 RepID=A0A7W8ZXR0_9MICO|nr:ATP-binding protein [Cryobacterium roopkundense]MBB5642184.1 signal transduction histidine kinase [Cryobacterium roopkundense]